MSQKTRDFFISLYSMGVLGDVKIGRVYYLHQDDGGKQLVKVLYNIDNMKPIDVYYATKKGRVFHQELSFF